MPNYMDTLFDKIKSGKGQKKGEKETEKKPASEKKIPTMSEKKEAGKNDYYSQILENVKKAGKPETQKNASHETVQVAQQPTAKTTSKPAQSTSSPKTIDEISKKIMEMRKETIKQAEEESLEDPEGRSKTEIEMEQSKKIEIDSYSNVKIFRVPGQELLYYWTPVIRPRGTEKAIINTIKEATTRIISITPYKIRDPEQRRNLYLQKVMEIIKESPELNIPKAKYEFYAEAVVREMIGYGIIDPLIKDDQLEEIMVIGPNAPVYIFHRKYEMMMTNIEFYSDMEIQDLTNRIARQIGRRVDIASPLLDARLPDGSRVNATIPPSTVEGSTLTIRKFREDPYTILELIRTGTLNTYGAAFLWTCVEGMGVRPANILIAGGTGSGKTTTLNVLASFIPQTERIITIEDTAELNLPLKHWIRMEARPPGIEGTGELTLDILTKNSLRMRPDRIIVGEIRHDEAFSLFTAFNTGHDGSLGTVHANSAQETIVRVTSPPMNVPEVMMSGLNFIIVQHRLHDKKLGTIRRITEIAEVTGALKGSPKAKTVFRWDPYSDMLKMSDEASEYMVILEDMTGFTKRQIEEEINKRSDFLSKLVKEGVRGMNEVSQRMRDYLMEQKKE